MLVGEDDGLDAIAQVELAEQHGQDRSDSSATAAASTRRGGSWAATV